MLLRRLILVILAFAVALAPNALEACETSCAGHAEAKAAVAEHAGHQHVAETRSAAASPALAHSCHHQVTTVHDDVVTAVAAAANPGVTLTGGPHTCGHSDDLPVTSGALTAHALHAPAIVPTSVQFFFVVERTRTIAATTPSRDSVPIALTLPLRV